MSNLGFSQTGYPKKVTVNKDTVIALTPAQVKIINLKKFDLDVCNEINDSLISKIKSDSVLIVHQNLLCVSLREQISTQGKIIDNNNAINSNLQKDLEKAKKLYNRQKIKTGVMGGISVVLTGIIVGLLIAH